MRARALTTAAVCAVTLLGAGGVTPAAAAADRTGPVRGAGADSGADSGADFNGDGYPDLAIGAHTATVDGVKRAGVVTVAYGSATGLRHDTAAIISQATPGVPGDPTEDGRWRAVSAHGDLDGDGYDDLVVTWAERHTVLWGSADGLTGAGTTVAPGIYRPHDPKVLGGTVGVGDVNGDGVDDFITRGNNGASYGLSVRLGPLDRTTGASAGVWFRNTGSLDKLLTSVVHVGDLTGDGIDDIVVSGGVVLGNGTPGGVVLKGSATGLVKGSGFDGPQKYSTFYPSALGDLNKDGHQDLVTGHPEDNKIYVAYGGPHGIGATPKARSYTQAGTGVPGLDEEGDRFGSALAIGDTDRDGYDDVIIGASYETGADPATTTASGAITVLRGSASGITTTGAKSFTQNSKGVPSTSENNDHFGSAVAVLDTDRDGNPEVYVGGNGEDGYKGRVWTLPTDASTGVTGTGATSFHLGTLGGPATGGNFGYRMGG
ncbi:FG-GAP and VCBS repeat-containing protein [Streptomyces sp. NPDC101062]|uniref:FG-GAP and VCBS repeat-containing protein n=1 Tax=unclassified Streptomyces TaxID=2593676 RepID=UPI00382A7A64